MLMILHRFRRR